MVARMFRRLLITSVASVVLVACGGGSEDDDSKERDAKPKDARAGYFHEAESEAINPAMATYAAASKAYYDGNEACNATTARLYKAGATPRSSVKCHFTLTKAVIDGVAGIETAVQGLDGQYRDACDDQVAEFTTFLGRFEGAWQDVHDDWTAYANGKDTSRIDEHAKAADDLSEDYVTEQVPALTKACYTKSDRDEADEAAKG